METTREERDKMRNKEHDEERWYLNGGERCEDFNCGMAGEEPCVAVDCPYCQLERCGCCTHLNECIKERGQDLC